MLHTDTLKPYVLLTREFADHKRVNHKAGQYVSKGAGTNQAENFFAQLKRPIDGTHDHVSHEHLPRYLAEFDFRHSTREINDTRRMERLMGQVGGRRLTYKPMIGR